MRISKKIFKLAEKIKEYRTDEKLVKELEIKKEALEKQVEELEKSIKLLKLNTIEQNKLLEQIEELEVNKKKLKLDLEKAKEAYTFIVTTPNEASNTVYGEIIRELSRAQQEILISSPWITHIIDELSSFKKKGGEKDIIIISFARSKKYPFYQYKLKFIENETLVNVAITRAKKKLILVGNSGTLCQSKLLKNIVNKIGSINRIVL